MKHYIPQLFCILIYSTIGGYTAPSLIKSLSRIFSNERDYPSPADRSWQCGAKLVRNFTPYLSTDTEPIEYWLEVTPNPMKGIFKGEVKIRIVALRNTRKVEINVEGLRIKDVLLSTYNTSEQRKISYSFHVSSKRKLLIIETTKNLLAGHYYEVNITFKGHLYRNNPFGFAVYQAINEKNYMAETLFDPVFAAKAFPCYDDLRYKTPFTIIMNIGSNEKAVSNYFTSSEVNGTGTRVTFKITEPVPINAIYYAVLGEGYRQENIHEKYFVWTVEKYIGQVLYAVQDLERVTETMKFLLAQELQDSERIDLVVPIQDKNELELLSYTKKNLLVDVRFCSEKYQQEVTRNIIQKVSNRWFGNYVSIRMWNHFWMRDGIGTYYGFKISDMIKPDWRMSDFHGSIVMQSILVEDKITEFPSPLTRTHDFRKNEIYQMMYSPESFEFYKNKASLIIRMLEHIVGETTFNNAMKRFLQSGHEGEGLVTPRNLWEAFEQQLIADEIDLNIPDSKTLSNVMELFTTQQEFPILKVKHSIEGNRRIIINQFHHSGKWIVPITMTTKTDANFENMRITAWSVANQDIFLEWTTDVNEWFILNLKNTVLCRVLYPMRNWLALASQLASEPQRIHPLNRVQLIADSYDFAIKLKLPVSIPIIISSYLWKEQDPLVLMAALNQFKRFYATLNDDLRPSYKNFFVKCLKNEQRRHVFRINSNDNHATKMWKSELTTFLCWIGDSDCINEAKKLHDENNGDLTRIDPEFHHAVACTMLREPDSNQYLVALNRIVENTNNSCLRDLVQKVSVCKLFQSTSNQEFRNTFNSLLQRTIAGDQQVEAYVNEILSFYWNTLPSFVKVAHLAVNDLVFNRILGIHNESSMIKGLAKFISYMKERKLGVAELFDLINMSTAANDLYKYNSKYKPIKEAVSDVVQNMKIVSVGGLDGGLLLQMLEITNCEVTLPLGNQIDDTFDSATNHNNGPSLSSQIEELRSRNASPQHDHEDFDEVADCSEDSEAENYGYHYSSNLEEGR